MTRQISFIIIFLSSVFIASISQVLLKRSANKDHSNIIEQYLNLQVIGAYVLFFLSTIITVFAYRYVPLSYGPILESMGFVFIAVLGRVFLGEKIGKKKVLGMVFIVLGITVCST